MNLIRAASPSRIGSTTYDGYEQVCQPIHLISGGWIVSLSHLDVVKFGTWDPKYSPIASVTTVNGYLLLICPCMDDRRIYLDANLCYGTIFYFVDVSASLPLWPIGWLPYYSHQGALIASSKYFRKNKKIFKINLDKRLETFFATFRLDASKPGSSFCCIPLNVFQLSN